MLLVFHRTGSDGHIGQEIGHITPVGRIQHFVRGGKAGFFQRTDVHSAHGDQAGQQIRLLLRIRLMDNALITLSGGPRLVGVDPGDQKQLISHLILYPGESVHVITDRIFVIS